MNRLSCHVLLLAVLAAPLIEAQAQNPPPPPPPTKWQAAYSIQEAPENLVYKIYFREFAASQRAADQRREQGKDDTELRTLFQRVFGLNAFEHQVLAAAAQASAAALEDNRRATQQLTRQLKQTPNQGELRAQLKQLEAASEASVAEGVQQLRSNLDPARFQRLDLMIRVHVVPNLKIVRGAAPDRTRSGGK
jgi:hypothetical protein